MDYDLRVKVENDDNNMTNWGIDWAQDGPLEEDVFLLGVIVEVQCPCCEVWEAGPSLWGISFIDPLKEPNNHNLVGVTEDGPYSVEQASAWNEQPADTGLGYLGSVVADLLVEVPAFVKQNFKAVPDPDELVKVARHAKLLELGDLNATVSTWKWEAEQAEGPQAGELYYRRQARIEAYYQILAVIGTRMDDIRIQADSR